MIEPAGEVQLVWVTASGARRFKSARSACRALKCDLVTGEREMRARSLYGVTTRLYWQRFETPAAFFDCQVYQVGDGWTGNVRKVKRTPWREL